MRILVYTFASLTMVSTAIFANTDTPVAVKSIDVGKVEGMVQELESLADKFDEEVVDENIEAVKLKRKVYRRMKSATRILDNAAEKIRSKNSNRIYNISFIANNFERDFDDDSGKQEWEYAYWGLNYRGAGVRAHDNWKENLGLEFGVTLPILYGIDLGVSANSLFTEGENVYRTYKMRTYLFYRQQHMYLGMEYLPDLKKDESLADAKEIKNKDRIVYNAGFRFGYFYGELDFVPDSKAPYRIAPEIGLRIDIF